MYDCAVPGCKAKGVHNFPRNEQFRKLWEIAARMSESTIYNPTRTCKICAAHFKPVDYFKEGFYTGVKNKKRVLRKNVIPSRFPWNTKKKSILKKMGIDLDKKPEDIEKVDTDPTTSETPINQEKNLQSMDVDPLAVTGDSQSIENNINTEHNVFPEEPITTQTQEMTTELNAQAFTISTTASDSPISSLSVNPVYSAPENPFTVPHNPISTEPYNPISAVPYNTSAVPYNTSAVPQNQDITETQNEASTPAVATGQVITEGQILQAMQAESKVDKTQIRLMKQKSKQLLTLEHFKNDNLEIITRTGIDCYEKLMAIFGTLGTEVYFLENRRNVLCAEDQFFLTLIKLRQNKEDSKLAKLFSITPAVASNIFITWVDFLYEKWKMIRLTPERVEILVSPNDYLSQPDSNTETESDASGKKGKKGKAKKKESPGLPPVPDTIPVGVSAMFTILQVKDDIKHVSKPKLYLVCKILCCFIDGTVNPMIFQQAKLQQ